MKRTVALLAMTLALCACASSYDLGSGDANYDAIKDASAACKAHGGEIQRLADRDGRDLSDYQCRIGKGR
jgi:putative hemolysin